jgi:transcriptional regulator with XRE-family HTH domain
MAMMHSGVQVEALAKEVGVSASTVTRWRSGSHLPDAAELASVAGKCGVTLDWLVNGVGDGPNANEAA